MLVFFTQSPICEFLLINCDYSLILSIDFQFNTKTGPLKGNVFGLELSKQPVVDYFETKSDKTDRDWPVLTQIHQNGPLLASLDPNLPKRTVIDQFFINLFCVLIQNYRYFVRQLAGFEYSALQSYDFGHKRSIFCLPYWYYTV